jgi:hypothetical protein
MDPFKDIFELELPDGQLKELWKQLKELWNRWFWNRPVPLLVAATIIGLPGGVIAAPIFAGRAAYLHAERTGHKHAEGLGFAFGALWLAMLVALWAAAIYWFG